MQLSGKRVLITGGALRVGAAIVKAFAAAGAETVIHCRNSQAAARELAAGLPNREKHHLATADLAIPGAAEAMFRDLPPIDILINNASLYSPLPLSTDSEAHQREHLEVNFWSALNLMKAFCAQPGIENGAIVNLLDQEIAAPSGGGGAYSLSRRMLAEATRSMAKELGPRNIRVNGIAPGPVIPPPHLAANKMAKTLPTLPLRRKVELDDLTAAVLFLVRNESITGDILYVDCGQHL